MPGDAESSTPVPDEPEREPMVPQGMMVRIETWTAWLTLREDPNNPEHSGSPRGVVGLKMLPGEILQDLSVTALPFEGDAKLEEDGEKRDVGMKMYGFEAVLVRQLPWGYDPKEVLTPQPSSEDSAKMVQGYIKAQQSAQRQAEIASGVGTQGHRAPGKRPRPIK